MPVLRTSLITVLLLAVNNLAIANECMSKMPAGIKPAGQVKLCHSDYTGLKVRYSCQDYQKGDKHFRVLYNGGLAPKAILKISSSGQERLIYSPSWGDQKMNCPLNAPDNIPTHANHRGLGICMDENDADIPCSVYEHTRARQTRTWRYLVFYRNTGKSEVAHRMVAGDNHDAMVAEIAYQLGLSLLETSCCSEQATAYLGHAHRMFPKVTLYRTGYLDALLQQLAVNEEGNN